MNASSNLPPNQQNQTTQGEPSQSPSTAGTKPLVVLTGCSGLIGSRIAKRLSQSYTVVGLDQKEPEGSFAGAEWISCDLTESDSVESAVAEVGDKYGRNVASVVHLAAYYDFSGDPSPLYDELTVEGTRRLLRALYDFEVEQFIFSSSLLVMKSAEDDERIDAHSPLEAEWDYPKSKLAAEKVIENERGNIPALILRIAGVYDEHGNSIPVAQHISRIYEKQMESYFFPGNAQHGQSFIHLDDLVDCFEKSVELRKKLGPYEVFLIGEEDVMSYEQMQDAIGELLHGREWPTMRIPKALAKAGAWAKEKMASSEEEEPFIKPWMVDLADQNYPVDLSRPSEVLQWTPKHTLRETLPKIIGNLRQDPEAWYKAHGMKLPEDMKRGAAAETQK